jgi:hypothetical protein|tara:strand:- start:188 stop:421 length:234 start_codon:yes stop_codon:yes gene_type:complete
MSECEIIDLPWLFKDTSKETEEEEMELFLPLSLIKKIIISGYDPTSLQDIEEYVLKYADISTATYYGPSRLRHDNDG